ncbi:MAG TPA: UPF0182 family protein, partial [Longimicrobiales bacterium]|nr:UPF0182 family protein [Longimicrobiales bacterium]
MDDFPGPNQPNRPNRPLNLEALDPARLNRLMRRVLWVAAVVPLLMALNWAQTFYTDWHWFAGVGYEAVLVKITVTRVVLYLTAVALFLTLAVPLLMAAHRTTSLPPITVSGALPPREYGLARKLLFRGGLLLAALASLFLASYPASEWQSVLLLLDQVPFGERDPIFGLDLAFFVFTLPAITMARTWLLGAVVTTMLLLVAFYYAISRLRGETATFRGSARKQLAILGTVLFILIAAGHWLSRYELLYSSTGTVFGVGYTDALVNLPGQAFMAVVALVTAGLLLAAALFYRGRMLVIWPVVAWVALSLLVGSALPALVQRLRVVPSELAREREYLAHNIEYTRRAFGLEGLARRSHPARGVVDAQTVAENQGTLRNVRLWDESPLLQSYNQIQFFRLYYDFLRVHTDRYYVNDELRQVMLATRELSAEKLPAEAQRWVNRRLQFTHGYGVAMSPVTEVEPGGRPSFFLSDVPPTGEVPLERPEIYYGLKSLDYVIPRSGMQEFNFPGPDGPEYTRYGGTGGVPVGSLVKRLAYAWEFKDLNILISSEIEAESRIQYRRTVAERISTITPFLVRDGEPYSVVADGRILWIQDAYTVTTRYPYSTRWRGQFNYIRNSVKAVVDAYDGTVDYYVFDDSDPLIRTYMRVFPGLFRSYEEMPDYLRAHVRYPEDLFTVQSQMMLQYHMRDPVVFYNKEDQWSIPM